MSVCCYLHANGRKGVFEHMRPVQINLYFHAVQSVHPRILFTFKDTFSAVTVRYYLKRNEYNVKESFSVKTVLSPYENGSALKKKKFTPRGSKFLPFTIDIFPEGILVQESRQEPTNIVSLINKNVQR